MDQRFKTNYRDRETDNQIVNCGDCSGRAIKDLQESWDRSECHDCLLVETKDQIESLARKGNKSPANPSGNWSADWLDVELLVERLEERATIINGISDALMMLDVRSYEILDMNQAFLDKYKISYDQAIRMKCYEITHKVSVPCSRILGHEPCPLEESMSTGETSHVVHVHKDFEGNNLYSEITAYPLKDKNGEVTRIIHMSREVSHIRRAE